MRRGAVADLVEASLDLNPESVVEMTQKESDGEYSFESTAVSEPEADKSGASAVPIPPPVANLNHAYDENDTSRTGRS